MPAERCDIDIHEWKERQGAQNFVKFSRVLYLENADVGPLPRHAPKVEPLALALKLKRSLMLLCVHLLDRFRVDVVRHSDGDAHVKQHESALLPDGT
jgi:hypothetical protein